MISRHHDLDLNAPDAPSGYGKCRACGWYVDADHWASEECPGPTRKEEDT